MSDFLGDTRDLLRRTPDVLRTLLTGLPDTWTAATCAVHDLDHVSQVFAGLAGPFDAEVGPWMVYLGILFRRDDPAAVPG